MSERRLNKTSAIDGLIWQALNLYPIDKIEQFLLDPDLRVRSAAINKLHINGGAYAFFLACDLMESRIKEIKLAGIALIGQIQDLDKDLRTIGVKKLVDLLSKESSSIVKIEVITSLGHLRDKSAIWHLLKFLTHKNKKIRAALAVALSRFSDDVAAEKGLNLLKHDKSSYVRYWAT